MKTRILVFVIFLSCMEFLAFPQSASASFNMKVDSNIQCDDIDAYYDKFEKKLYSDLTSSDQNTRFSAFDNAKHSAREMVSKWPDCRYAYINRASLIVGHRLIKTPNDIDFAISDLNKAIEIIKTQKGLSTSVSAQGGIGTISHSLDKSSEGAGIAYKFLGDAYMLKCSFKDYNGEYKNSRCIMSDSMKSYIESAIQNYTEALNFNSDDNNMAFVYSSRAEAYEIYGDKKSALNDYTHYLKTLSKKRDKDTYGRISNKIDELLNGPKALEVNNGQMGCMVNDKLKLDFFIMSYCPYGVRFPSTTLNPMKAAFGAALEAKPHFILGPNGDGTFSSMHGPKEVEEDLRQICIRDKWGMDKWTAYFSCFSTEIYEKSQGGNAKDWKYCAGQVDIKTDELEACVKNDAPTLAQKDIQLSQAYGAQGSPTAVYNCSKNIVGAIPFEQIKKQVCKLIPGTKPTSCVN